MPRSVALFLFLMLPAFAFAQTGLVKAEKNLPLRADPKNGAKVLDQLPRFQPVKILDRKDQYVKVKTIKTDPAQSRQGWVLASYVSDTGFLTVNDEKINVRRGPGTEWEIILNYSKPYPVFVLDVARNGWVKAIDADGDLGWINPRDLSFGPRYVITRSDQSNIRSGGGKDYEKFPVAFIAERGVYLKVLEEKDGWLHVKHDQGQEGWISAKVVFGYVDAEQPKPKAEAKTKTSAKSKTSTKSKSSSTKSKTSTRTSSKSKAKKSS